MVRTPRILALLLIGLLTAAAAPPGDELSKLRERILQLQTQGKQLELVEVTRQALDVADRQLGKDDPESLRLAAALAQLQWMLGDRDAAVSLQTRLVDTYERLEGPKGPSLIGPLTILVTIHMARGEYDQADRLNERILRIAAAIHGEESAEFATRLQVVASSYQVRHDYARAAAYGRRALAILEKVHGKDSPALESMLGFLAWLDMYRGDLDRAQELFERAYAIYVASAPDDARGQAMMLQSLAQLHATAGREAEAAGIRAEMRALFEKNFAKVAAEHAPGTPWYNDALSLLAGHMSFVGDLKAAEPLYRRLLDAYEAKFGKDAYALVAVLPSYEKVLRRMGRLDDARRLLKREYAIVSASLGPELATNAILEMGGLETEAGNLREAEKWHRREIEAFQKTAGKRHWRVAMAWDGLARNLWARGRVDEARKALAESQRIHEPYLATVLSTGTESDRRLYLANVAYQLDERVAFNVHAAPEDPEATAIALRTVLGRKGRLLDAVAGTLAAMRRRLSPEDRALLDELAAARARLATLVNRGPGKEPERYERAVASLGDRIRELEQELGRRSPEFRARTTPLTLDAVRDALPAKTALVELVVYRDHEPLADLADPDASVRRYAAWVLRKKGPPILVPLGAAAEIDALVPPLREALASRAPGWREPARDLDRAVLEPIGPHLKGTSRVLIGPDGALNLVPFAALVGPDGRPRIEAYDFSYLSSGRDLLRLKVPGKPRQAPTLVADPAFGEGASGEKAPDASRGTRSIRFGSTRWAPLPGTAAEAEAIAGILDGARLLEGPQATEQAIKAATAPRILHIATHGFFVPAPAAKTSTDADRAENPLLRSGLVLAGANRLESGSEDGVLTALEAASLDLWGTRLVALSACETGVGQVETGDGVYGLKRALVIAGAESQLLSLWKVDDAATKDLMVAWYERLDRGEPRASALREAQLAMLRSGAPVTEEGGERGAARLGSKPRPAASDRSHPYYWASFTLSGAWGPL